VPRNIIVHVDSNIYKCYGIKGLDPTSTATPLIINNVVGLYCKSWNDSILSHKPCLVNCVHGRYAPLYECRLSSLRLFHAWCSTERYPIQARDI